MTFVLPSWGWFGLSILITIMSAGRLTRLITADHWPPVEWFRAKWDARSEQLGGWWLLAACHWCLGPWMTLLVGGWAVIDYRLDGYIDLPWWLFNGWLAASYATSMLVHHDEGKGED